MPLYLTSADQGSQEESYFVQVHGEALILAAHSRRSPRGTSWCVIRLLSACQEDKQDSSIISQSLARQGRQKSNRSKTLFIGNFGTFNVAEKYHIHSLRYVFSIIEYFQMHQLLPCSGYETPSVGEQRRMHSQASHDILLLFCSYSTVQEPDHEL